MSSNWANENHKNNQQNWCTVIRSSEGCVGQRLIGHKPSEAYVGPQNKGHAQKHFFKSC